MKIKFLVDENVLYHAIRGVDKSDEPSLDATRFLATLI